MPNDWIKAAWGEGASAVVFPVNDSRRLSGWRDGDPLPAGAINGELQQIYRMLTELRQGFRVFDSIAEAEALLADYGDGSAARVWERDDETTALPDTSGFTGEISAIASDGVDLIIALSAGSPVVYNRDTRLSVRALSRFTTGTNRAIHRNGDRVAVAYGQRVALFTVSTGARLWDLSVGRDVYDVYIWDSYVYWVGTSSASICGGLIGIVTGTNDSNLAGAGARYSVVADVTGVYVCGAENGSGGATLERVTHTLSSSGSDSATWEGVHSYLVQGGNRRIGTDGTHLIVSDDSGGVSLIDRANGATIRRARPGGVGSFVGMTGGPVCFDGEGSAFVLFDNTGTSTGSLLYRLDAATMILSLEQNAPAFAQASFNGAIAADGGRVWCGGAAAAPSLYGNRRGNSPRSYVRCALNGRRLLRFPHLRYQPEGG